MIHIEDQIIPQRIRMQDEELKVNTDEFQLDDYFMSHAQDDFGKGNKLDTIREQYDNIFDSDQNLNPNRKSSKQDFLKIFTESSD